MYKTICFALSYSNLCFLLVWSSLFYRPNNYSRQAVPFYELTTVMLLVMLLAFIILLAIIFARRNRIVKIVSELICIFAFMLPINGVRKLLHISLANLLHNYIVVAMILVIAGVALYALCFNRDIVLKSIRSVVILLFPFVIITFSNSIWIMLGPSPEFYLKPSAKSLHGKTNRVLWLIFDEMDYRLAFLERPIQYELPMISRIREYGFFATNAFPPAGETLYSMPALVNGALVSSATPIQGNELMISFDDYKTNGSWGKQSNVFSAAKALGFNGAIVGWAHPYCRLFGDQLVSCREVLNPELSFMNGLEKNFYGLVNSIPLVRYFNWPQRREHLLIYKEILDQARIYAVDPNLNLIMATFPIPHPPFIFDAKRNAYSTNNSPHSYFDNLVLVDNTIGEIMKVMESHGLWDNTHVIISSDHWFRFRTKADMSSSEASSLASYAKLDHRVPFILKLANQKAPVTYGNRFNTVLTHDLILALLNSEINNTDELVTWLDTNRSFGESKYTASVPLEIISNNKLQEFISDLIRLTISPK